MKALSKILLVGLMVFLVLAMLEEREVFLAPLQGESGASEEMSSVEIEAEKMAEAEPAIEAVRHFLSIASHLYASGGDRRFSDRLPASPVVVEEIWSEIAYLQHHQRRQEMSLMNLEILDAEIREQLAVVHTREYWVTRSLLVPSGEQADPTHSTILQVEYRLAREGQRWEIKEWDLSRSSGRSE